MDRDAVVAVTPQFEELVPPPSLSYASQISYLALGLVAVAAVLGWLGGADWLNTIRLWCVGLGTVAAGYAVSLRPSSPKLWLMGAGAFLLAGGLPGVSFSGLPESWDSAQFMFRVLAGVAVFAAGLAALTYNWRLRVASVCILFHFFGIFLATTSPTTHGTNAYWVTEQLFNKVFIHYLQFVYLRNAYHFYSPEPGPASLLLFLIKTEVGTEEVNGRMVPKYERRWVILPRRPHDIKDPLGVSYFRRLSLTEQVAAPGNAATTAESSEIHRRRKMAFFEESRGAGRVVEVLIPFNPFEPAEAQYRIPSPFTSRYLLPSYAQNVIYEESPNPETMKKTTVMVYQLVHRTMNVLEARNSFHADPYAPSTYRAYYLGEYDVFGNLVNPKDPMLYWNVPVYPKQPGQFSDPNPDKFEDYLSRHAGLKFDWGSLR